MHKADAGDLYEENASNFSDFYKYSNRNTSYTLEKRREDFLRKQKEKRGESFDEKRDLSELFSTENEPMECEFAPKIKHAKKYPFGYKLMGSEWFTQVPDDLSENWIVKLCPEGIRFLVVANKATTTCYYQNGRKSFSFKSKLPGGSSQDAHKFTLLDCIHNKQLNVMLVYDVLAWNSVSLLNSEAHMRFYWIKTKFNESPELLEINKNFRFALTDFFPADLSLLQEHLFSPFVLNQSEVALDGLLFYHKEGHYVFGNCPLVGWLKTFMLPEIFNIDVHPSHLSLKPADYVSVQGYLHSRKKKKKDDSVEMKDVEEVEPIDET